MMVRWLGFTLFFAPTARAWPYDEGLLEYNINQNETATDPASYWGEWPDHEGKYFPSPENWRFPFYTLFLDRFVNGDPTNDNINGSSFEHDLNSNSMRHGGDVAGLVDSLDYLQGMGIKGLYIAGTAFLNPPWAYHGYSVLDTTLLDRHFGTIQAWRDAITEIHARGMYVIFDHTLATMGDLIGFEGYLNTSAPFSENEHQVQWKSDRRYMDFDIGNSYNATCDYPRFWSDEGYLLNQSTTNLVGCYDSDFDQYGDLDDSMTAPAWKRQLSKYSSAQDRLREWYPPVQEKLIRHSCMLIASLDIDGFRYDKASGSTLDALGDISKGHRECARRVGKHNFFITGEMSDTNSLVSLYIGRGRQPNQYLGSAEESVHLTNESEGNHFLREEGHQATDASAFHYGVYGSLAQFLGLSVTAELPVDFVDAWNLILQTNDLINANTGRFDPRHMFGTSNQDIFRWPALENGVARQLLGLFIATLLLPGIPTLLWGEEQAFYIIDATSPSYLYGRQPMSPATAWKTHGCFLLGSTQYPDWPIEAGLEGCHDESVVRDHRDPAHPVRNIIKHMFEMRTRFPVLNDGYSIQRLSKQTEAIYCHQCSDGVTETGMWSVVRDVFAGVQDLGRDAQPVWLLYQNVNRTKAWEFDCNSSASALIAPFPPNTLVKNLFYPYDELELIDGPVNGSTDALGCYPNLTLNAFEFRAYVPIVQFNGAAPMVTKFLPGHDTPLVSTVGPNSSEAIPIELHFSEEMDCESVTRCMTFNSSTEFGKLPSVDHRTIRCRSIQGRDEKTSYTGQIPSVWTWAANLTGVYNGVHHLTLNNASNAHGTAFTSSVDHFLFRIGQLENPMIFPSANYSKTLLQERNGTMFLQHHAAGADMFRYSTNWGTSFTSWTPYNGGEDIIHDLPWSGTKKQTWQGKHIRVEYWNRWTGSSSYVQEGDIGWEHTVPRRFPHAFFNGPHNQYGYDAGLDNEFKLDTEHSHWKYHLTSEWPAIGQVNIWGMNPDGHPDGTWLLGDVDNDHVLDRMVPSSLSPTVINITDHPPSPYLSWELHINDATMRYELVPVGHQKVQLAMFFLFAIVPVITGVASVYIFVRVFYKIQVNTTGVSEKKDTIFRDLRYRIREGRANSGTEEQQNDLVPSCNRFHSLEKNPALLSVAVEDKKRTVLMATLEYAIADWAIKIKIGGLGVMAQLMAEALAREDHNIIWVVPCVGGIDYPQDQPAKSITVTILGEPYVVEVQHHIVHNITYILLDTPIFRQQTKDNPYPARMDDLTSAMYYSAWNQCIAQVLKSFPIDIYHINDYHGALAPLYLLPTTLPVCLSLHNAEFQGLWRMRTPKEKAEICSVFNLNINTVRQYVQFGEVFNLLHAGASYLRIHQQGFGAVGVSKKYGKRSYTRYPIFWGLRKVGDLPNPDPSDVGNHEPESSPGRIKVPEDVIVEVDTAYEISRLELKRQAQEWAGLDQDANMDLLVFVGRWSKQKGIDLIADVMPSVLDAHNVQLICVGPVIDLYGKFAALKLNWIMDRYPGRVLSRPEYTNLPPFVFSGADFALIPSRDEPFGLVAVEFGRKGALGIGARVGGLGQMPGWWYKIESTSTSHHINQFRLALEAALRSETETRALMRSESRKQRFPVAEWVRDLEILQSKAIRVHRAVSGRGSRPGLRVSSEEVRITGLDEKESDSTDTDGEKQSTYHVGKGAATEHISVRPLSTSPQTSTDDDCSTSTPSIEVVPENNRALELEKLNPLFTDSTGQYYRKFNKRLENWHVASTKPHPCIEEFLIKSQRKWFEKLRKARLGRNKSPSSCGAEKPNQEQDESDDDFHLGKDHVPPTAVKKWMQVKIGNWPVYSLFLALGQIIAANSYQIPLLTGEIGQTPEKLYALATTYAIASIFWWVVFRRFKSVVCLSAPWFVYAMAYVLAGSAHWQGNSVTRGWIQNVASGLYAAASSSGSIFFAANFGDEGYTTVHQWISRACVIQGLQQAYSVALWYWGSTISKTVSNGHSISQDMISNTWKISAICYPIAVLLCGIGLLLAFGLPPYYHQDPGNVPAFYRSIRRRRIFQWNLVVVIVQSFFLTPSYGRNWTFLWNSAQLHAWHIGILCILFFGVIWLIFTSLAGRLSKRHSWFLPIFACGLGAPRFLQIWWGVSGIGYYLPWVTGGYTGGALASRALWLWLGVLDCIQDLGFGIIILQTLTRMHVCFTRIASQVLGCIVIMCARAMGPNRLGPGPISPDLTEGVHGLANGWFVVALLCQLLACAGFLHIFRGEQLSKH